MSLQAISKHLEVLERAGLITRGRTTRGRTTRLRPPRLHRASLQLAAEWLERHQRFWEGSFDRLDEHLRDESRRPAVGGTR
jgi:predicted transcriptional regulator